jgi:hypothetical protein
MNESEIEEKLAQYKKEFSTIFAPPNLTKKELEKWKEDAWLWKEGKEKFISGGGRVLVFLVLFDGTLKKHLEELKKKKSWENYFEALQFQYRQNLLGIDLIKILARKNSKYPIDYILNMEKEASK